MKALSNFLRLKAKAEQVSRLGVSRTVTWGLEVHLNLASGRVQASHSARENIYARRVKA
jgi:hypothetical protein